MKKYNRNQMITYGSFAFLMIALGSSDAMRGVFAPIFQQHFILSNTQLSTIIMVSYLGNLFFLLIGGYLADKYEKKPVVLCVMLCWFVSVIIYLITDSYIWLLIGMFIGMGTSTLMNTLINIMTRTIFIGSPIFIINTLFFVQGIGTTGGQKIVGNYVVDMSGWKIVNMVIAAIAMIGIILFMFAQFKETKKSLTRQIQYGIIQVIRNPAFFFFFLILGFYFIGEHGILNWFTTYIINSYSMKMGEASNYLAIFFGGITLGRLCFAMIVQKLGLRKSITIFGGLGVMCYVVGMLMGERTIFLLSISGLFLSVLYPTLIMLIQDYYERDVIATATGTIISLATVFDIVFNWCFGRLADYTSIADSFPILSISMVLFYIIFILLCKTVTTINENIENEDKNKSQEYA